jgi:hypothetical protein
VVQVGTVSGANDVFNGMVGPVTSFGGRLGLGTYYIRVIAASHAGVGPPSDERVVIVPEGCRAPAPGRPGNLTAQVDDRTVTLTWTPPGGGSPVTGYRIDVQEGHLIRTTPVQGTRFVAAVPPGSYLVAVRAESECYTGPYSNAVQVTVVGTPISSLTGVWVASFAGTVVGQNASQHDSLMFTLQQSGSTATGTVRFFGLPVDIPLAGTLSGTTFSYSAQLDVTPTCPVFMSGEVVVNPATGTFAGSQTQGTCEGTAVGRVSGHKP